MYYTGQGAYIQLIIYYEEYQGSSKFLSVSQYNDSVKFTEVVET